MRTQSHSAKISKFPKAVVARQSKSQPAKVRAKTKGAAAQKVVKLAAVRQETPTPAQQEALILKYRLKARKLGRSILRRWHARLDIEEVDSLVDLSLCEAVKRFNPYKGATFMTFLFYHLKGNLVRAVTSAAAAGAIPVLNLEALEEQAGVEAEHFLGHQFRALNSDEVADALSSEEVPMPDEVLWRKELQGQSAVACEKLDDLEREIVKRIFIQEQQIMDIAASLGYSRCHISRVKKKALNTLQNELRATGDFDDFGGKGEGVSDELEVESSAQERKTVFRRRPRSKVSRKQREHEEYLAEAA